MSETSRLTRGATAHLADLLAPLQLPDTARTMEFAFPVQRCACNTLAGFWSRARCVCNTERMPRRTRASGPCIECHRFTTDPRRGLCTACYHRRRNGAQTDACACCGVTDRAVLVRRRVGGEWVVLCGNDSVRLGRRSMTLDALRAESAWNGRERRNRAA